MKVIIYLLICSSVLLFGCFNCERWIEKNIKPKNYNGVVVAKNIISPCFGEIVLLSRLKFDYDTLKICYCGLNKELWDSASYKDIITKPIGSDLITLRKDTCIYEFKYPCCDQ